MFLHKIGIYMLGTIIVWNTYSLEFPCFNYYRCYFECYMNVSSRRKSNNEIKTREFYFTGY